MTSYEVVKSTRAEGEIVFFACYSCATHALSMLPEAWSSQYHEDRPCELMYEGICDDTN